VDGLVRRLALRVIGSVGLVVSLTSATSVHQVQAWNNESTMVALQVEHAPERAPPPTNEEETSQEAIEAELAAPHRKAYGHAGIPEARFTR